MVSLVLCPSPLTRAAVWGGLPAALSSRGADVVVVEPEGDETPPYALRWVASCALQIAAQPAGPVVLVGHSGAGLLLARLGFAIRAAHRPVAAYAFLDAGVPRALRGSRLDVFRSEDPSAAAELAVLLEAGAAFPTWGEAELADDVPDQDDRRTLVGALRPRGTDYWTEELPPLIDWPDAPCVYLQTSAGYEIPARTARGRGWPTDSLELGHFPGFSNPESTAQALLALLRPVIPDLTRVRV